MKTGVNKKILVVDDDIAILDVIKIILEDKGYTVLTVSNGANVYSTIVKEFPHLILLDIWMSGFDGRDIARELKAQDHTKNIPIIIISAHNETEKMAHEAGAQDFLPKPFDIEALLNVVEKHLPK